MTRSTQILRLANNSNSNNNKEVVVAKHNRVHQGNVEDAMLEPEEEEVERPLLPHRRLHLQRLAEEEGEEAVEPVQIRIVIRKNEKIGVWL